MGTSCCLKEEENEIKFPEFCKKEPVLAETSTDLSSNINKSLAFSQSFLVTLYPEPALLRYTRRIIKLQAHIRGFLVRKPYRMAHPFSPSTIIQYIRFQIEEVTGFEYEPISLSWELSRQNETLRLRGLQEDEEGRVYAGYWNYLSNEKEGYGVEIGPSGDFYEGFWKRGLHEGYGHYAREGDSYKGEWHQGLAEGHGIFRGYDNIFYEGDWKQDRHHGNGKEIWEDGSIYEGNYVMGIKQGEGKFEWTDGSSYVGGFCGGYFHWKGRYEWSCGRTYDGEWRSNQMNGLGKMNYENGRSYEGEFKADKRHGHGTMWWPDGKKYEGGWEYGQMHGKARVTHADGTVELCTFKKGLKISLSTKRESI